MAHENLSEELIGRLRKELVDTVDELADPGFPAANWRPSKPHPISEACWPLYMDYFVYDNNFDSAPEYNIGLRLRNSEEATAVGKLASAVKDLVKAVGYYADPQDVLQHPSWPQLVLLAQQAKQALSNSA